MHKGSESIVTSSFDQRQPVSRRGAFRIVALALGITASIPASSALAALKMPLKESPPRVLPLGRWGMLSGKNEVNPGNSVNVEMTFRSATLVTQGVLRWWRKSSSLPICAGAGAGCAPNVLDVGVLVAGTQVPVTISIAVPSNTATGYYRVNCEMSDPDASKRRSLYSFLVRVVPPRQA